MNILVCLNPQALTETGAPPEWWPLAFLTALAAWTVGVVLLWEWLRSRPGSRPGTGNTDPIVTEAVQMAQSGNVVYLRNQRQEQVAAIIPLVVAHVAETALNAIDDAHDRASVQAARDEIAAGAPLHRWDDVKAELGIHSRTENKP